MGVRHVRERQWVMRFRGPTTGVIPSLPLDPEWRGLCDFIEVLPVAVWLLTAEGNYLRCFVELL